MTSGSGICFSGGGDMNCSLLKLADKNLSGPSERFFVSQKDDTALYVYASMRWCECGKTEMGMEGVFWDLVRPVCADVPFGGWIVVKLGLTRDQVVDWLKEHLNYGVEKTRSNLSIK